VLSIETINRWKYNREFAPEDARRRYAKGHGMPPQLRDTWINRAVQISIQNLLGDSQSIAHSVEAGA
jgi:hypothetical protein